MKLSFLSLALIGALAAFPAFAADSSSEAKIKAPPVSDKSFAQKAAEGGMFEVEASKLAEDKAEADSVKAFAKMMVSDHDKINEQLQSIAEAEKITLPTALSARKKAALDDLSKLEGKAFDKAYVDKMVMGHEKTVAAFKAEAEKGDNADLKAFAKEVLPTIEGHLSQIREIQSTMK